MTPVGGPVMVFGVTGLLGRALFAQEGVHVVGPAHGACDIRSLKAVHGAIETLKPVRVINCAAFTAVDAAESHAREAFAINAEGAENVALVCQAHGVPLVHISTDYVLGPLAPPGGWTEAAPHDPVSVYGHSKASGESYVLAECPSAAILRVSGLYNLRGEGLLGNTFRFLAAAPKGSVPVILDQTFCLTSTEDVARAALALDRPGLWHFAGPPTTRSTIAAAILTHLRRPVQMQITNAVPGLVALRPANSTLNTARFFAAFGFLARPWHEGLKLVLH